MEVSMEGLRYKEVISLVDGSRFGYVGDVSFDVETGQIQALIIHGRLRCWGFLGREEDFIIPWQSVSRFGEDIILVEHKPQSLGRHHAPPRQKEKYARF